MATLRLLVVDDEPEIREVVCEYLEGIGHHVDAAGSGKQAIEALAGALLPYDVAIVDWTMPGIAGRDVVMELQRKSPSTVVIVATGKTDLGPVPGLASTPVTIMHKPFSLRDLARSLDSLGSSAEKRKD